MRLSTTFLVSSLAGLLVTSVAAIQFPRDASPSRPRSVLSTRQYKAPRAIIDTCISITGQLLALLGGILNPEDYADLRICVCLNDLELWLATDVDAQILIGLLGIDALRALVTLVLTTNPTLPQECTFPDHSQRICVTGEPCAFECEDGYTEEDGICVCAPPNIECNGVCGSFPGGCGSILPRRRRRLAITTLAQAKSTCKPNESVCGISGREDTLDFECVDTRVALDSCGGCVTPHPFYERYRSSVLGVECGRLSGAITATCTGSRCVVSRCRDGQAPSADGTQCIALNVAQQLLGSTGPLRLDITKGRDLANAVAANATVDILNGTVKAVIDAAVVDKIESLVKLVLSLSDATGALPNSLPISANVTLPVDANLISAVIQATINLGNSSTVPALLSNLEILVDVVAAVANEALNLDIVVIGLDAVGQAASDLKNTINLATDTIGTVDLGLELLLADLADRLNVIGNVDPQSLISNLIKLVTPGAVIANAHDIINALKT